MFLIFTPVFLLTLTLSEAINFRNQIIPRPGATIDAEWNINYRSDNPVYENTAALLPLASGFAGYRPRQDLSMQRNAFYNRMSLSRAYGLPHFQGLYAPSPMQPEFSPFFYYKRAIMKFPEKHMEHNPRCLWSFWNSLGFGHSKETSSEHEEKLAQNKPQESKIVDKKPISTTTTPISTTTTPISTTTTPISTTTTPISTTTTPISTTTTPISTTTTPISTTTTPISTTVAPISTTTTPISTTTTPISAKV